MNSSFWKRLRFFATGLVLGSIMVYFIFGERACSWLPGNRIKEDVIDRVIVFPESEIDALEVMGVTENTIYDLIVNGKINFKESIREPNVYPKSYVLEQKTDSVFKRVQFSLYEDSYITVVHALEDNKEAKIYDHLDGWGRMVKFPRDTMLVFIDKSNYTQCKSRGLISSKPNDIVQDMIKSGRIDFENSDLTLTKATHRISFIQNDDVEVNAETIWYKHRITFKDFFWDEKMDCEE